MPAQDDAVELAVAALRAADGRKAVAPALLEVADVLGVIDLFAIASATSERHLKALAEEVERVCKQDHARPVLRREGTPASGWLLLDYGDVVVHLFHPETRSTYDLERLWADVPRRDPLGGEITDPGSVEEREPELVDPLQS